MIELSPSCEGRPLADLVVVVEPALAGLVLVVVTGPNSADSWSWSTN